MLARFLLSCLVLLSAFSLAFAQSLDDVPVEESIGAVADPNFKSTPLAGFQQLGATYVLNYRHPGSDFLRVRLVANGMPETASLTIAGRRLLNGRTNVSVFGAGSEKALDGEILSDLVFGDRVTLSVTGVPSDADLTVESIFAERTPAQPQLSIYEGNDLVRVTSQVDPALLLAARATVYLSYFDGESMEDCSGILVSHDLVLTNDHCINDADKCKDANIIFDYNNEIGEIRHCRAVRIANYDLDYALIEMNASAPDGIVPLHLSNSPTPVEKDSVLIQHPLGEVKQIATVGCLPLDSAVDGRSSDSDFSHRCDTAEGSSGSPVIVSLEDGTWCVVGLHHWGFTKRGFFSDRNRAVQSKLIWSHLRQAGFDFPTCHVP